MNDSKQQDKPARSRNFGTGCTGGTWIGLGFDTAARQIVDRLVEAGHDVYLDEDLRIQSRGVEWGGKP